MKKLDYVMKKVVIDSTTINEFFTNGVDRRKIRTGIVSSLTRLLLNGGHFDTPFVANLINGKREVIDANHRHEALLQVISKEPEYAIEVWVAEYKNLSFQQSLDVFDKWNKGTKQSATDYIKLNWKTVPLGSDILRKIPCSIYGSEGLIKVKNIVGSHILSKKQATSLSYSGSGMKVVLDLQSLNNVDINTMKQFMKEMSDIFGAFNSKYAFWTTTATSTFYRIWYDNKDMAVTKFKQRFERVFLKPKDVQQWKDMCKNGGSQACTFLYNLAMQSLGTDFNRTI